MIIKRKIKKKKHDNNKIKVKIKKYNEYKEKTRGIEVKSVSTCQTI